MTKYFLLQGTEGESQEEFLPVPLKVGKVRKLKNKYLFKIQNIPKG